MTDIQKALDDYMRKTHLRSVTDLIYVAAEDVIVVVRKMGFKNCVIDIKGFRTVSEVMEHLESVPAIY